MNSLEVVLNILYLLVIEIELKMKCFKAVFKAFARSLFRCGVRIGASENESRLIMPVFELAGLPYAHTLGSSDPITDTLLLFQQIIVVFVFLYSAALLVLYYPVLVDIGEHVLYEQHVFLCLAASADCVLFQDGNILAPALRANTRLRLHDAQNGRVVMLAQRGQIGRTFTPRPSLPILTMQALGGFVRGLHHLTRVAIYPALHSASYGLALIVDLVHGLAEALQIILHAIHFTVDLLLELDGLTLVRMRRR